MNTKNKTPIGVWPYVKAMLYYKGIHSCLAISKAFPEASHDCLTRLLNNEWMGQTLLTDTLNTLFSLRKGGFLQIDDTVIEKPYSKNFAEGRWTYSNKEGKIVFGIPLVLLVWNGEGLRIPIAYRTAHKGGPSKIELALEMLSFARNHLKLKPDYVLFDSFYSSQKILKRISDYRWYFVCQLKKNRHFENVALKDYKTQPYWNDVGFLSGGLKVKVVKHRRKYYATNRLGLEAKKIRELYKERWGIEEIFKILKSELALEGCQAGSTSYKKERGEKEVRAQDHHVCLNLLAYLILEKDKEIYGLNWRQFRQKVIIRGPTFSLPSLQCLQATA